LLLDVNELSTSLDRIIVLCYIQGVLLMAVVLHVTAFIVVNAESIRQGLRGDYA